MTDIIIHSGSLSLTASVFGPADAPDVLFLHGLSNSRDTWEETVRRLEDRHRVWTLDFRGHGHSDRADSYLVADYASDAAAALKIIGRPTIVVGFSLGGLVAASLAQGDYPAVTAAFLVDPPLYLDEKSEWERCVFSKVFPVVREQQVKLQSNGADLAAFIQFAANAPAIQGGRAADHISQRHLDSIGSALQRHDPATWAPALDQTLGATFDAAKPMRVPVKVIQADPALGPILLEGHEKRFMATNPDTEVLRYEGATHRVHMTRATEPRFLDDVDSFVTRYSRQ